MLKIEIENYTVVAAQLRSLMCAGTDLRPALKAIGEALSESTRHRFATSTDPQGRRWKPNSITTELANLAFPTPVGMNRGAQGT